MMQRSNRRTPPLCQDADRSGRRLPTRLDNSDGSGRRPEFQPTAGEGQPHGRCRGSSPATPPATPTAPPPPARRCAGRCDDRRWIGRWVDRLRAAAGWRCPRPGGSVTGRGCDLRRPGERPTVLHRPSWRRLGLARDDRLCLSAGGEGSRAEGDGDLGLSEPGRGVGLQPRSEPPEGHRVPGRDRRQRLGHLVQAPGERREHRRSESTVAAAGSDRGRRACVHRRLRAVRRARRPPAPTCH